MSGHAFPLIGFESSFADSVNTRTFRFRFGSAEVKSFQLHFASWSK